MLIYLPNMIVAWKKISSVIAKKHAFLWSDTDIHLFSTSLSSAKGSQGDSRRGGHAVEFNGPVERRKSCTLRSSQEAEQVGVEGLAVDFLLLL